MVDGYMTNASIFAFFSSLVPLFIPVDSTYFLMKRIFPTQAKSFWITILRTVWNFLSVHRWHLATSHAALYVVSTLYFLTTTLNFGVVNPRLITSVQESTKGKHHPDLGSRNLAKRISTYRQIYILLHCHNMVRP